MLLCLIYPTSTALCYYFYVNLSIYPNSDFHCFHLLSACEHLSVRIDSLILLCEASLITTTNLYMFPH